MPALPEVTQAFVADVSRYVGGLAAASEAAAHFADANAQATRSVAYLQAAIDGLHGRTVDVHLDLANNAAQAAAAARTAADANGDLARGQITVATTAREAAAAQKDLAAANYMNAIAARMNAGAQGDTGSAIRRAATAGEFAARFWTRWGGVIRWVTMGTFEFLAVFIPAMAALGSGLLVAAEGAGQVKMHFQALYTATEALNSVTGATIGSTLGLGSALQKAQTAARPGVFELVGSALAMVGNHMSTVSTIGTQVVHMFDEFAARVNVDLQKSSKDIVGLFSAAVPDLQMFGQILGNVGHAILNLAVAAPGLAKVLLLIADAISRVILWLTSLPRWLLTTVIVMEEVWRWGGLVSTLFERWPAILGRLGAVLVNAVAGSFRVLLGLFPSFIRGISGVLTGLSGFIGRISVFGNALRGAEGALASWGSKLSALADSPWTAAIGAFVVAIGVAIFWISRIKDSTQQWIAATNDGIGKARTSMQAYELASQGLAQGTRRLAETHAVLNHQLAASTQQTAELNMRFGPLNAGVNTAAGDASRLAQELQHLNEVQRNILGGAALLAAKYGISVPAAMALADQAGIDLTKSIFGTGKAALIARQQVENLVQGYKAMGVGSGQVGAAMQALAIQSGLAATQVQKLNSAMDQWMAMVTGGTQSFSQLDVAVRQLGHSAAATSASLSGTFGSLKLGGESLAHTLNGVGMASAQTWQQLDAALSGPAQQLVDWFHTAGAAGVASGSQITRAYRDVVAMFVPLVAGNKTATAQLSAFAQEAGGPATNSARTLSEWAGIRASAAMRDLQKNTDTVTQSMSNMSKVASNLGNVILQDAINAIAKGIESTAGLTKAIDSYIQAATSAHGSTGELDTAQQKLTQTLRRMHLTQDQVNQIVAAAQQRLQAQGNASLGADLRAQHLIQTLRALGETVRGLPDGSIQITEHGTGFIRIITSTGDVAGGGGHTNPRMARGGVLPGYAPGHDTVPAMLSPGEGVLTPGAVRMIGPEMVHHLNRMGQTVRKFAGGGIAGYSGSTSGLAAWTVAQRNEFVNLTTQATSSALHSAVLAAAAAATRTISAGGFGGGGAGGGTPNANAALARRMYPAWGSGAEWMAWNSVAMRESGWNAYAANPTSNARGIAQNISGWSAGYQPGNAGQQIAWMINYIRSRYGDPLGAWRHEMAFGWYDQGGKLPPGLSLALNTTGRAEVLSPGTAGGGGDLVVEIDGRELLRVLGAQTYKYNLRNSGRVTGNLRPG